MLVFRGLESSWSVFVDLSLVRPLSLRQSQRRRGGFSRTREQDRKCQDVVVQGMR